MTPRYTAHAAGWLAGILDGESHIAKDGRISIEQHWSARSLLHDVAALAGGKVTRRRTRPDVARLLLNRVEARSLLQRVYLLLRHPARRKAAKEALRAQ